jgi:hypothetical protein
MAVSIHPLGFIRGGNCDRLHRERSRREMAAPSCVIFLLEEGLIVPAGRGKYRVGKLPRAYGWKRVAEWAGGNTQTEIALWRVLQSLLPVLRKEKAFTIKRLRELAVDIQKFTFELGGCLDPIRITGQYGQPHYSAMYQKRKEAGHFAPVGC